MSQRTRTPLELTRAAGRLPVAIITAALAGTILPVTAAAQPARDPLGGADAGSGQVRVSDQDTVDLQVKEEDLTNVLELLSIQSERNIIVSKNVSGKVTASLYSVTFYEALDAILHVNGFGYIEQGGFIYVYTIEEIEEIENRLRDRVAKRIALNYLNAEDAKIFVEPLLSEDGGEIQTSAAADEFSVPDDVPVGGEDYALSGMLVIYDYPENIEQIERLIGEIDTRPEQVLVECTILQAQVSEANAFGVDFSVIVDLEFADFLRPLNPVDSLINGLNSDDDNRADAVQSTSGNTDGAGNFKIGIANDDYRIFIRMLDEVTDTTILSNPKILTLNRQPSRVLVGRRVGYLSATTTDTATTQTVEFLDTGTQLYIRPFVSENDEIRMELKPQVSEAIIRDVTDASGATVTIPDEITQEISTNVIVRDEQTIVLGGLFRESTQATRTQVPILGDLPLIGQAFRGNEDTTDRQEIIFMITPSIVTDSMLNITADRAFAETERIRTGSRKGLIGWSRTRMSAQLNMEAEKLASDGHYDEALHKLSRSTSINPVNPAAYRLRERITGQADIWENPAIIDYVFDSELEDRLLEIEPKNGVPMRRQQGERDAAPVEESPMFRNTGSPNRSMDVFTDDQGPDIREIDEEEFLSPQFSTVDEPLSSAAPMKTGPVTFNADGTMNVRFTNTALSDVIDVLAQSSGQTILTSQPVEGFVNTNISGATFEEALTKILAAGGYNYFEQEGNLFVFPVAPVESVMVGTDDMPEGDLSSFYNDTPVAVDTDGVQPAVVEIAGDIAPVTFTREQQARIDEVSNLLPLLRAQIEEYATMNGGAMPTLDEVVAWSDLISAELLEDAPVNTWIGGDNSSVVVSGTEPDDEYHAEYGWIFNEETGDLWAAGFDAFDMPIPSNVTTLTNATDDEESVDGQMDEDGWPTDLFSRFVSVDDVFDTMKENTEGDQNEEESSVAGVGTDDDEQH